LKNYEKKALLKFTFIYFISTLLLVLVLGYFYYGQQKMQLLQAHTMMMHQFGMNLKQSDFKYTQDGYSFEIEDNSLFAYKLATKDKEYYKKAFPMLKGKSYLLIKVESQIVDKELTKIQRFTIMVQIALIIFFLVISFLLARISLRPVNDTISHLDRFIKDLIHDLNTPATSILLNTKMLKKEMTNEKSQKKLNRIENSANAITSFYENLEILITKKLECETIDIYTLLEEEKANYNLQYPDINIKLQKQKMELFTNKKAMIRIINNILSNACKYSNENAQIDITFKNKILIIKDNGKGMKYPKKIFERSYSENELGHGIGMHIVQRLCEELDIKIDIDSRQHVGTMVSLDFK